MTKPTGILVFIETDQGKVADVSLELLAKSRELADQSRQPLLAALLVAKPSTLADTLSSSGVNTIILAEHASFSRYSTLPFASVLTGIIQKFKPSIVLLGATPTGRDLAPRVAARLQTGLSADCIDLTIENGLLHQIKPSYGGQVMAEIICPEARPQMATVRPHVFPKSLEEDHRSGTIVRFDLTDRNLQDPLTVMKEKQTPRICSCLEDARVIVCGGRGLGDARWFGLCEDLAGLLSGMAAGTRPVVEDGWIGRDRQIGLSGQSVRPDLLILCGISGSMPFSVGIREAKTIIAINRDPKAPVFQMADYGIVGDAQVILPLLIDRLE